MRSRAIALVQQAEDVGRRLSLSPGAVAETEIGSAVQAVASAYQLARKQLTGAELKALDRAWSKEGQTALAQVAKLRDAIHHDAVDPVCTVRLFPGIQVTQPGQVRIEPGASLKVEGWFEVGSEVDAFEIGSDGIFRIEKPGDLDETRLRIAPVAEFVLDNRLTVGTMLLEASKQLRTIWAEISGT